MLSTKKFTVEAKIVVDGKEIAGHRAILNEDKVTFLPYQIDGVLCKEHRAVVRADQAEFEDYCYKVQEELFKTQGEVE